MLHKTRVQTNSVNNSELNLLHLKPRGFSDLMEKHEVFSRDYTYRDEGGGELKFCCTTTLQDILHIATANFLPLVFVADR